MHDEPLGGGSGCGDALVHRGAWGGAVLHERGGGQGPGYVEYRLGDQQHELGIIDRRFAPKALTSAPGGAIVYWHVDDVASALERLQKLGATLLEPVTTRGPGFVTASVVDPFGNVLGLMFNRHFLDMARGERVR